MLSDRLPPRADASASAVEEQRRELQARIDALQQAGLLPAQPVGDPAASIVQWTNWSNG
ncbi:MAG: hypothetical protein JNL87_21305 [Burkholderiaceae bacterium]|nr:hypothetical protein [Burkholderiaceae bacterium]